MQLGMLTDPRIAICWKRSNKRQRENNFDYVNLQIAAPAAALETTEWKAVGQAIADAGLGVVCSTQAATM